MDMVRLGRTELRVSVASLGTGGHSRIGHRKGASFDHSVGIVRAALDQGMTLVDTATLYGTEEIVGAAIAGRRDEVVVSTKEVVYQEGASGTGMDLIDGPELVRRVEGSLARLKVDHVDIMHLHGVCTHQYEHCRRELVPALLDLRQAGKIRFLGLTERFGTETSHALFDHAMQDDVWDVFMIGYNIFNQTAAQQLLPATMKRDIGTLCMYAVREALITIEAANRLIRMLVESGEIDPADLDADPLGFLLADGVAGSLPEAAYRFCRHTPGIDVILSGTGSLAHLEQNIRSINAPPLPPATTARLNHLFRNATSASGQFNKAAS